MIVAFAAASHHRNETPTDYIIIILSYGAVVVLTVFFKNQKLKA